MMGLRPWLGACLAVGLTLWAALIAFAAEAGDTEDDPPRRPGEPSIQRRLHVAHLALLILAALSASVATDWWAWPPALALLRLATSVLFVWVVADLVPRMLAALAPELGVGAERLALRSLAPLRLLVRAVAWADARGGPSAPVAGEPAAPARDVFTGLFTLSEMSVAEVMTPRIDIVAVDSGASRDAVLDTLRHSEHARLLVYDGHPDNVAGVLYAKDVLATLTREDDPGPWQALVRPATFVPEGKTLDRQLRDFQQGPSHLAVVVDEFGGTAGLVTLEDILEQVVGEIRDEYDTDEAAPVQPLADGAWRVQGGVPLSELEELIGAPLEREDVATVGGLVLAELGRVPRGGDVVRVAGAELTVELVARRRVRRVLVRRAGGADGEGDAAA